MPGKFLNDDLTSVLRAMREDKELSALFLVILGPILIIGIFIIAVTFTCFFLGRRKSQNQTGREDSSSRRSCSSKGSRCAQWSEI